MVLEVRINIILGEGGSRWWLGDSTRVISRCLYVLVAQSCLTLCDPMECSLQGSSFHGIFQARILEWVAISCSRGSSPPRDWTHISCIAGRLFIVWATISVVIVCLLYHPSLNCPFKCWAPFGTYVIVILKKCLTFMLEYCLSKNLFQAPVSIAVLDC